MLHLSTNNFNNNISNIVTYNRIMPKNPLLSLNVNWNYSKLSITTTRQDKAIIIDNYNHDCGDKSAEQFM